MFMKMVNQLSLSGNDESFSSLAMSLKSVHPKVKYSFSKLGIDHTQYTHKQTQTR